MQTNSLKTSTLLAFAGPAAPIAGLGLPLVVHLPPFYAEDMELGLTVVGTVFMLTRLYDVVVDPVLGVLSDRMRTRWGRRRPWLVLSVPILVLSVYKVFMPAPPASATYLLLWLLILYAGWSLLTIAHLSWGAELSDDYHERSRVQGLREMFLIAGMITVLTLPAVIEQSGGSGPARVAAMGWFIIGLLPLTIAWAVLRVPERPTPVPAHVSWRRAAAIIADNRPLRRLLFMDLVGGLAGGIVAALFIFITTDELGLGRSASLLLLCYFVSGCLFVPLMVRVSYRFGKHRTLAASATFNALALPLVFVIPHGSLLAAVAVFILWGVNMGVGPFLFRSIMADVADHDRIESGAQRTGLYFSLLTMTNKLGYALAIGIVYPLLDWIGYVPGGANSEAAIAGLASLYVWPPALCSLLVAVLMWNYPLDETRQQEMQRIIEAREAQSA